MVLSTVGLGTLRHAGAGPVGGAGASVPRGHGLVA